MVRAYRWLPLLILPVAWQVFTQAQTERREAWPPLAELVPRCHLIVHCRLKEIGDQAIWRVLDIWRGESSPLEFPHATTSADQHFDFRAGGEVTGGSTPESGAAESTVTAGSAGSESILFFFKRDDGTGDAPARADLTLPIRNGRVVYPPRGEEPDRREYPLAELKREIARLGTRGPSVTATRAPRLPLPKTPQVLAGKWRVFLPAGFEREVELVPLGGGRYKFKPGHLTFGGVYHLADGRLELVEPSEPRLAGFTWEVRTPYLLTLVAEAQGTGASYLGGVLFRPNNE